MTLYTKPRAELFAQDAPSSEIKPFTAWLRGLGIAFDETNGFPEMESFNGLLQVLNGYIKYLEQNGFAEWSADLEYPVGAGVRVGAMWYRAKVQNLNKPPATSQNDWAVFLNANDLSFDDPLQVVDGVIGIKDASTTQKGVARFATATEVSNRTNVSAAITPANVGQTFGQSLSQDGWCRLPNGLIMQWGKTTGVVGNVNFLQAFNSVFFVTASPIHNVDISDGQASQTKIKSFNNTSFSYSCGVESGGNDVFNPASLDFTWFAIGY